MGKNFVIFGILLLILLGTIESRMSFQQPSKLYVIGLYSKCLGQTNRTKFNMEAETIDVFYTSFFASQQRRYSKITGNSSMQKPKVIHLSFDICENMTQLASITQNLKLNKSFEYVVENDFDAIISVIMYAPDDMVRFVQAFFPNPNSPN